MAQIEFFGSLYRAFLDEEGESKVTFKVPLSHLDQVLTIGKLTGKTLKVTVEVDEAIDPRMT